jgi:hypothetical protein
MCFWLLSQLDQAHFKLIFLKYKMLFQNICSIPPHAAGEATSGQQYEAVKNNIHKEGKCRHIAR